MKGFKIFGLIIAMLTVTMMLAACGDNVSARGATSSGNDMQVEAYRAQANSAVTPSGNKGVIVKYDITAALNSFSTNVYGRTFPYTKTGAIIGWNFNGNRNIPDGTSNTLESLYAKAGLAAYGNMANGVQVVLAGFDTALTDDPATDIAAGAVSDVTMWGMASPANQDEALALVKQIAPARNIQNWSVKSNNGGEYVFYASGTITLNTKRGPVEAPAAGVATVTRGSNPGKSVVSVLLATGKETSVVK